MAINKNVEFALKYNKDIPQIKIGDIVPLSILVSGHLQLHPLAFCFYLDVCLNITYEFEFIEEQQKYKPQYVFISDIYFS